MDKNTDLPVVHLELTTGVFKIKAENAIYEIEVKADSSLTQVVEKIVEKEIIVEKPVEKIVEKKIYVDKPVEAAAEKKIAEADPEPAKDQESPLPGTDEFYKEISEEMFNEIGKMARDLSISIKTPMDDDMKNVDISQAGVDLESAKGKLQDIVKMTEKATMEIMDISEDIQDGCDEIKKNLEEIQELNFVGKLEDGTQEGSQAEAVEKFSSEDIDGVIEREEELKEALMKLPLQPAAEAAEEPEPETGSEPETKIVKVYNFDIDVVFQTLYELCTNEQVKSHIKSMREERSESFAIDAVLKEFSEAAPGVDVEDNFFNFSLPDILKILFQNTSVEKYKKTLKKMHQSAANIFLDQTLPIEGSVEEKEVVVEKQAEETKKPEESSSESADSPLNDLIKLIDVNIEALKAHKDKLNDVSGGTAADSENTSLEKADHEKLIAAISGTDTLIKKIIVNISRILESLSFQDLSGQQIKKILGVLSSVQVQLLSMLVTFGVKLKKKEEYEGLTDGDAEEFAHKEVDKLKSKDSDDWEDEDDGEGPLDQNSVDDLLAELGF